MTLVFEDAEFAPGKVMSNHLELNLTKPLRSQPEQLYEGLIWVQFGPHLMLDVDWRPALDPDGTFYVTLATGEGGEYRPLHQRTCDTATELRSHVADLMGTARAIAADRRGGR